MATKEAADPSLVAIAAFPEVAEKAFSEDLAAALLG